MSRTQPRWLVPLLVAVAACLDHVGPPSPPRIARLEVFAADSALLVGHTLQVQVRAWDSTGQPVATQGVRWSSGDTTSLTVDATGLARALTRILTGAVSVVVLDSATGVADSLLLHVAIPGEVKWRLALGPMPILGGPAQGPDGTIYVIVENDVVQDLATLYAISPRGTVKWQRALTEVNGNYPIIGLDGAVHVVGHYLWAFTPDGSPLWSLTTRPVRDPPDLPDFYSAAIADDNVLYVALGRDLQALQATSGDTIWQGPYSGYAGWVVPPTLSPDKATAYVKRTGDSLFAFSTATGALRWGMPDSGGNLFSYGVGPAVAGSRVVVPLAAQLHELDTAGGAVGLGPSCGRGMSEPAIDPDGTLYVQTPGCGTAAYSPVNVQLWRLPNLNSRWTWYGGPALAQGGVLYAAAWDGLYALDVSRSGATIRWRYPVAAQDSLVFTGAPLIGLDGTVYSFSSCNQAIVPCTNEVFAFWEDKLSEPNSPWPMWRHDARRSGQAGP